MLSTLLRLMVASCALALWIGAAAAQQRKCPANAHPDGEDAKNYFCTCNKGFEPIGNACMPVPASAQPKPKPEPSPICKSLQQMIDEMREASVRAILAQDVYLLYGDDSKGFLAPANAPKGFTLLSNQIGELRKMFPGMQDRYIKEMIAPVESTYRAAIYRDARTGKLIVAFRGSGNEERAPDWTDANIPNEVNLRSAFYDRAGALGRALRTYAGRGQVEFVGHSLGGGLAITAGLTAGAKTTVFNSATVQSAALPPDVSLAAAKELVTGYSTPGEALTVGQKFARIPMPGRIEMLPEWPGSSQAGKIQRHLMTSVRAAINHRLTDLDRRFADSKCTR